MLILQLFLRKIIEVEVKCNSANEDRRMASCGWKRAASTRNRYQLGRSFRSRDLAPRHNVGTCHVRGPLKKMIKRERCFRFRRQSEQRRFARSRCSDLKGHRRSRGVLMEAFAATLSKQSPIFSHEA